MEGGSGAGEQSRGFGPGRHDVGHVVGQMPMVLTFH